MPEVTPHEKNEDKKASGAFLGGFGTLLSGLGGLITGIVGVAGLFMAKPDLITVVVPVHTLERVIERAQEAQSAQTTPVVAVKAQAPPPMVTPVGAPAPAAPGALGNGLSAAILSIANTPDTLVANVRLTNETATPVMIAGRAFDSRFADFSMSDGFGGACRWQGIGNFSPGSLPTAYGRPPINPDNYKPVGPGQSVAVTLMFHKQLCDVAPSGVQPMTLSGTFVIVENDQARFASASFENVTPAQAN